MANRVCIISSGGGHLTEALKATELLGEFHPMYVTFRLPHTQESLQGKECYYVADPHISFWLYLVNFFQSFWIYLCKRPKVIITTGSGIAISMCLIGKIFGAKIVFIESGARIHSPSRTAKFLYPLADLFIVQWKSLLEKFPKAVYKGSLL